MTARKPRRAKAGYDLAVTGDDVNEILALVRKMYPEADRQAFVLSLAFATILKSAGMSKTNAITAFSQSWGVDLEMQVVQ